MLATSSSEAISSSPAITSRTIFTAPVTSRILFASSRLSPIGGSIAGLIGVGLPEALVGSSAARTASRLSASSSERLNEGGSGFELSSEIEPSRSPLQARLQVLLRARGRAVLDAVDVRDAR